MTEQISCPCPYMIFDSDGYHSCAILSAINNSRVVVCASIGVGLPLTYPVVESDVSKICPRSLTYQQIEAKMRLLK